MKMSKSLVFKTLVAIAIPMVLFTLIGCVPEEVDTRDYGPEAKATAIDSALSDSLGELDFTQANLNEYSERAVWAEIQGQTAFMQQRRSLEVLNFAETEEEIQLDLAYSTQDYDEEGNSKKPVSREVPITVCKDNCASALTHKSVEPQFAKLWAMATGKKEELAPKTTRVSYHNLKISRGVVTPPKDVRESPDCRGLSPCEIKIVKVNFDTVLWEAGDEEGQLVRHEYLSSPDLPLFSRFEIYPVETPDGIQIGVNLAPLRYCQSYAIQTTTVRVCTELVDFLAGQAR